MLSQKETAQNAQVSVHNFAFTNSSKKQPNADLAGIGAVGGKAYSQPVSVQKNRLQSGSPGQNQYGKFDDQMSPDGKSRNPNGKSTQDNMRPNSS